MGHVPWHRTILQVANCLRLAASVDWPYTHRPGDVPLRCPGSMTGPFSGHTRQPDMDFCSFSCLGCPGGLLSDDKI